MFSSEHGQALQYTWTVTYRIRHWLTHKLCGLGFAVKPGAQELPGLAVFGSVLTELAVDCSWTQHLHSTMHQLHFAACHSRLYMH